MALSLHWGEPAVGQFAAIDGYDEMRRWVRRVGSPPALSQMFAQGGTAQVNRAIVEIGLLLGKNPPPMIEDCLRAMRKALRKSKATVWIM